MPVFDRNHGSNFEQQKTAFEEADEVRSHPAEDEEKVPETRSEDISETS